MRVTAYICKYLFWVSTAVFLVVGCEANALVTVVVAEDGSGTVEVGLTMNQEGLQAVGGLDQQLRIDDLVDADWVVEGPVRLTTGESQIVAKKEFTEPQGLPGVLDEIVGPGVFENVTLERHRSFAQTEWRLIGWINLSGGLEIFSDSAVTETLSGLPLGRTYDELVELFGCPNISCSPGDGFKLEFLAKLPGVLESKAQEMIWTVGLGDSAPTLFEASGTLTDRAPRIWRNAAVVSGILAVLATLFIVARVALIRRADGLPRAERPRRTSRRSAETLDERPMVDGGSAKRLELLVLGGVGVVWDFGGDPEGLLVRFVRERGGIADSREIADRYRSASLGHVSVSEFWASIGVHGDAEQLDRSYLEWVDPRPDVIPFLRRMKDRDLQVACLTNSILPWSVQLRERLGLDELILHWIVSGEVGARKPSQAMFEALRRISGVPFHNMLLIDSEAPTLEAARSMGMSTVLMRGSALIPEGFSHPVIGGFAELFRPSAKPPTREDSIEGI